MQRSLSGFNNWFSQPILNFFMLPLKQIDAFMVRSEKSLEPLERFGKIHLPDTAQQIVGIGNDFLLRRAREIILFRQPQPLCLHSRNAGADMAFYYIDKFWRKLKLFCHPGTDDRVVDSVRSRPSDIMEKSAYLDEIDIYCDDAVFRDRARKPRDSTAMFHHRCFAACCN